MSIQYIRYENEQIFVRFKGVHRNLTGTKEEIDEIMTACLSYKDNPSEENEKAVLSLINPVSKEAFTKDFDIDDSGNLYLKGTKNKLPMDLASMVKTYIDNNMPIQSLVNFWKLCLANPNEVARDGFYNYVKNFGVVITDHGYAILYKAVNILSEDNSKSTKDVSSTLSRWVSSEYIRIKQMKKSPKNYPVFELESKESGDTFYVLSTHQGTFPSHEYDEEKYEVEQVGTLQSIYDESIEESKELEESDDKVALYKPWHSGDHGMVIRLGEPVTMPRDKCDPDIRKDCSYGLHVGSYKYVSSFGSDMDAILAILVNPRDVVALPEYDHSKIRVCEYFPYAEMSRDEEGNWEEIEQGYFEEDFLQYEIEELEELLIDESEDVDESRKEAINQRLVYLRDI